MKSFTVKYFIPLFKLYFIFIASLFYVKLQQCAVVVLLLSLSPFCVWAQPIDHDAGSAIFAGDHSAKEEILLTYDGFADPALLQLNRNVRRAPFLAGALVGAGIANNHQPSYYYPQNNYYPSSGYYNNGYYYYG